MIETVENSIQLIMTGICAGVSLYRAVHFKERAWVLLCLFSGIFFLGDLYWELYLLFYQDSPDFFSTSDLSWYTSYLFLLLLIIYIRVDICGEKMPHVLPDKGAFSRILSFRPVLWCAPIFTFAMCAFYMQWGAYLSNLAAAILMAGILWHAMSCLLTIREKKRKGIEKGLESAGKKNPGARQVDDQAFKQAGKRSDAKAEGLAAVQAGERSDAKTEELSAGQAGERSDAKAEEMPAGQAGEPGAQRMFCIVTLLFCFAEYGMWTASCFFSGDNLKNVYYWFGFLLSLTFLLFLPALRKAVVR